MVWNVEFSSCSTNGQIIRQAAISFIQIVAWKLQMLINVLERVQRFLLIKEMFHNIKFNPFSFEYFEF